MKTLLLLVLLSIGLTSLAQAPALPAAPMPAAENSPERAAILANDAAFEAAYAKADVTALADFFTEDADYTSEDGQTFSGRKAIQESLRAGFLANKGARLAIHVDEVRVLAPETVVEKGSTSVTGKSGETNSALYTAIHIRKDGKWKISQLIESPIPTETPHERLTELAWLIGEWEESDKTNDLTIFSQFLWARGGNFLTRNVTVKQEGNPTLEGWQVIGWDPIEERIRSWTFDNEGGFSEAQWTRDGNQWLMIESGVAPDGSRTTAENTLSKLSDDKFSWESVNRTLNGEPQPGINRIEINRVKGR